MKLAKRCPIISSLELL